MLNYIKSEGYRILHTKTMYITALAFSGLALALNIILYVFHVSMIDFPYATTSFSYSNLVANPMVYCFAAFVIVGLLYDGDRRNGNVKNSIAYGISRIKIFAGKCIVSLLTCIIMMVITLSVFIGSAVILLVPMGPVTLEALIMEIPAVSLISIAALILAVLCMEIFDKSFSAFLLWYSIMFIIPSICYYLGLRIDIFHAIAAWMPNAFFKSEMLVNRSICITIWDSTQGLMHCLLAGLIGCGIFASLGYLFIRKRDI